MTTRARRVKGGIKCRIKTYEGSNIYGGSIIVEVYPNSGKMKEMFITLLYEMASNEGTYLDVVDESRVYMSFEIENVFTVMEETWIFIVSDGDGFQVRLGFESSDMIKKVLCSIWSSDCNELTPSIIRYCFNKQN